MLNPYSLLLPIMFSSHVPSTTALRWHVFVLLFTALAASSHVFANDISYTLVSSSTEWEPLRLPTESADAPIVRGQSSKDYAAASRRQANRSGGSHHSWLSGLDYMLMYRGGGGYFNVPGESRIGYTHGLDLAVGLFGNVGFVGSINANHLPGGTIADGSRTFGTQVVGSLGVVKVPDYRGRNTWDSISFSCFFDQATDDRINTFLHSLYLAQLRLQLGYAISRRLEVGTVYSTSIIDDADVVFRFIGFASAPAAGTVNMSRSISAYAAGQLSQLQWSAVVGYRDDPGTMVYAVSIRRSLSRRLAFVANTSYQGDFHNWGAFSGFELRWQPSTFYRRGGRRTAAGSTTVRGQSPSGSLVAWVPTVPSRPGDQPDTSTGRFSQGDLQPRTGQQGDSEPIIGPQEYVPFTESLAVWNARGVITLLPPDFWRNLNGDGLTIDDQNVTQGGAGVKFRFGQRVDGNSGEHNKIPAIP